jgi:hypothetical protein
VGARLKRVAALMHPWSPLLLGLLVVSVFIAVQKRLDVDEFGYVADLSVDNMTRGTEWRAELVAARTHWATSIFAATVVMLAIAGVSLQVIKRARSGKAIWGFLLLSTCTIWISFHLHPGIVVARFLDDEMIVVRSTSWFNAKPHLLAFLSGLFSTAVWLAIALSVLLRQVSAPGVSLPDLVQWQQTVRMLLSLATLWLVIGVIGIGLFHRMASTSVSPGARPAMDGLGAASTIFSGALYSALLAAVFAPLEVAIRKAGASTLPAGTNAAEMDDWLKKQGLELSLAGSMMKIAAILGPLLAGVLQNLAELKL